MESQVKKRYFSEVDGLRTIAVMLVVIFHANRTWLPGGFIGVDVFFVISGFLITRNIVGEIDAGNWSFSKFYTRRVARLFPALYATIILTLIAGFFILNPVDLERAGRVSIFTVLSASNIFFWLESGYFDVSAEVKPFLHTWSLAVEEQFYLIWPLLLVAFYKFKKIPGVVIGLGILAVLSFAAAIYFDPSHPSAVFFLTPFRAYQFALGGIIGLYGIRGSDVVGSLVGGLGLAAIIVLGFVVNGTSSSHFMAATLPAVAATAVIYASSSQPVSLLLGNKAMVWVGQRSYSIYLAHWPLIVLWKIKLGRGFELGEALAVIVLSIILGTLLHWAVEKRFRFRSYFDVQKKSIIMAGVTAGAVAIFTAGAHYWGEEGYPNRLDADIARIATVGDGWQVRQVALNSGTCNLFQNFNSDDYDDTACATVDEDKPSYLIIGDSFASDAYLVMKEAYPNVHFLQMTLPGCQLKLPFRFESKSDSPCKTLYEKGFNKIARQEGLDGVIMASNWEKGHYYRVDDVVKLLSDTDLKFYVVGQHIRFKTTLPSIISSSESVSEARIKAQSMMKAEPLEINGQLKTRFGDNVTFIDFITLQCPQSCDVINDGFGMMYLDDSHLSLKGAEFLGKRLAKTQPDLF